ncbi:MAG TPA: LysR family transcriptional regulator [Spirochaetota bacterium]|nr:LysR family transcriptional regulator [Spirochaetota bacterium]HPJ36296.1 LysR family transcriptional regulator [Spirochaetota bacterium]
MPDVKIHLWFEKEHGVYFGRGRYELLRLIDELGSLKLAAERIGMSYRGAWGKLKKTEAILGHELIHKENNKEGYKLTDFGRLCMSEFKNLFDDVDDYAHKRSIEMLERIKNSFESPS